MHKNRHLFKYFLSGAAAISACCAVFVSCQNGENDREDLLTQHIDTTVRPQDDFFAFANGGWIRKNPIPAAYKSWGIGNKVQEDLFNRLRKINEDAVENGGQGISRQIAAFYASGMDTVALGKQSVAILTPELSLIDSIERPGDVVIAGGRLAKEGVAALLHFYIGQDDKNSSKIMVQFAQGGLGLPNRDYYLKNDARTRNIRAAYIDHIGEMLVRSGMDRQSAQAAGKTVYSIESRLAMASRSLEDLRDPYENYNKVAVSSLDEKYRNFKWRIWLSSAGVPADSLIMGQPEFFKELDDMLGSIPVHDWQLYMKWHLLHSLGRYVNLDFEQEHFSFYGKVMEGLGAQKPRWRRVLEAEQDAVGEALGQLFVKAYFPAEAKQRYMHLVEAIRSALKDRISQLSWMSDTTRKKALYKLSRMTAKVGYPDKWKDFSAMNITRQPYVKNIIAANRWWHHYEVSKLGKPVDRSEWHMTPQTYNAYYNPANNEIVLPAGIFTVPGRLDRELDDAIVYGYAGASTIGHEITHGFDDQGRLYDADGNLSDWWTPQDARNFRQRAEVMVRQFNAYMPVDSLHINGQATLGENIADLGGVLLGWEAFKKTDEYKSGKKKGGFSPAQRFFMGYALGWLYSIRPETLARQLLTDVHAPARYRVNGPFSDVDAFYETFNVQPGDSMYIAPAQRVRIW